MAKRPKTEKTASVALTMAQCRAIAESEEYKRRHLEIADDEPLLAANGKLVDAIARKMGITEGKLKVTHQIDGMWKFLIINGQYIVEKISKKEWKHVFGAAFPSNRDYSEDEDSEPEPPGGMTWYLAPAGGMVDDHTPHFLIDAMELSGAASRAAVRPYPLGYLKVAIDAECSAKT